MAQLLVRNLAPEIVDALKQRAARHGCSAEAEHRAILEQALQQDGERFWSQAGAFRAATRGRGLVRSEDLIREDRDRR